MSKGNQGIDRMSWEGSCHHLVMNPTTGALQSHTWPTLLIPLCLPAGHQESDHIGETARSVQLAACQHHS